MNVDSKNFGLSRQRVIHLTFRIEKNRSQYLRYEETGTIAIWTWYGSRAPDRTRRSQLLTLPLLYTLHFCGVDSACFELLKVLFSLGRCEGRSYENGLIVRANPHTLHFIIGSTTRKSSLHPFDMCAIQFRETAKSKHGIGGILCECYRQNIINCRLRKILVSRYK